MKQEKIKNCENCGKKFKYLPVNQYQKRTTCGKQCAKELINMLGHSGTDINKLSCRRHQQAD